MFYSSDVIAFTAGCPYEPYPGNPSKFWIAGDILTISICAEGMEFDNEDNHCDCMTVGPGKD